jgi:hypothetical protein
MTLRIGTFNAQNLFERAKALNLEDEADTAEVIKTIGECQAMLKHSTCDKATQWLPCSPLHVVSRDFRAATLRIVLRLRRLVVSSTGLVRGEHCSSRMANSNMHRTFVTFSAVLALSGCAAQIREVHHFATVSPDTGDVANIFRVSLSGTANFASVRYLPGYYDERAVDLFFNESKSTDLSTSSLRGVPPIFGVLQCEGLSDAALTDCRKAAEERLKLIPVGGSPMGQGAFVMILSTDVDAIANTIGSLASNQELISAVVGLVTRDERQIAATIDATKTTTSTVTAANVTRISEIETAAAKTGTEADYLSLLRAVGAALAPSSAPAFTTMAEAEAWFAALPREVTP